MANKIGFSVWAAKDLPATEYYPATKKDVKIGYIVAENYEQAKKILANKLEPIKIPILELKDYSIGFSDQYEAYEIGVKGIPTDKYNAADFIIWSRFTFEPDKYTLGRLESKTVRLDVLTAFDLKPFSKLELESELPTVTRPNILGEKSYRHWYWLGWVYRTADSKYYYVYNPILKKYGLVKSQAGLLFANTALSTNFEAIQRNLLAAGNFIDENIYQPIKETIEEVAETSDKVIDTLKIVGLGVGAVLLLKNIK